MESGAPAHATPGRRSAAGAASRGTATGGALGGIDLVTLQSLLTDSIAQAVKPLHEEIGALRERVQIAEELASHAASESGDSGSERSSSSGGDSVLEDTESYLRIDPASNQHFGAADIANSGEFKPHRHELYGHRPYMVLTKGGNDNGGTLGFALSYAEPLSLFGKAGADAAESIAEQYASGACDEDPEAFLSDLVALRNNLREQYRLTNVFRSIIVQKARAMRPGATAYDKAEVKYVERVLNERDFATPDTAAEIEKLRGRFATKSNKHDLERLSKKASGGGGGGGDFSGGESSDDDSDAGARKSRNKKKREKAKAKKRERAERERVEREKREKREKRERGSRGSGDDRSRRDDSGSRDGGERSSSKSKHAAGDGKRRVDKGKSRSKKTQDRDDGSDDDEAGFE